MTARMHIWHKAPFIRYTAALAAGILLQWYLSLSFVLWALLLCTGLLFTIAFFFLPIHIRFRLSFWQGVTLIILFIATGAALTWLNNPHNNKYAIQHIYQPGDALVMRLEEPLTEKQNSFSAEASFRWLKRNDSTRSVKGKAILYFKKDSAVTSLGYGSVIVFSRSLQPIKNAGNPGGFDYRRYCLFQGITHQAFLSGSDYRVLPQKDVSRFWQFIYSTRLWVRTHLKTYITGDREQAFAEAILIGYKNDLDKNLVQSYSNTGVVHIIAISGLHLGLIYALIVFFTRPLKRKRMMWLRLLLVLTSLWMFSILAGAQPSVLRAALMFTFLSFSEVLTKKLSVYNTITASAFILLCINPFYLWDVGFQLSYAAVLGIVTFYNFFKNLIPSPNKFIGFFVSLLAVTTSAQVFTLPISVYHFHQMPLLFLFSNLVAVPLGSVILVGEVILCALAPLPWLADKAGTVLSYLIGWLNEFILWVDGFSFSVWNSLSISFPQLLLLLVFSGAACLWMMEKQKQMLWIALYCFSAFLLLRSISLQQVYRQQKLIVYNVPRHSAVDLLSGAAYQFVGDTTLLQNELLRNFHLQPSRILHRVKAVEKLQPEVRQFRFGNTKVCIIDSTINVFQVCLEQTPDLVILSGNPRYRLSQLSAKMPVQQLVLDGSVPAWKAARWQHDADSLGIACHNVAEKGAFVLNLH
ncbi:MAG: ComEC/Rec2 family competence protein [Flavisolibacter sp.]